MVEHRVYKAIQCPTCGFFHISVDAERHLAKSSQERRDDLARTARDAPDGYVLVIRIPDRHENKDGRALDEEYVRRSDLSK
jgi:hypothetical protein